WGQKKTIKDHIEAHLFLAEALAASSEKSGEERLWCHEVGDKAAVWLSDWRTVASDFPDVTLGDYTGLLGALMRGQTIRPRYGAHPRLSILGPLEARLLHHDVIILGGMNENTWPPAPVLDPWLSRPMKAALSLPTPERRIGLSAHDFVALAAAPRVLITRSCRVGGVPTVPSRFLLQMQAVLKAASQPDLSASHPWRMWAREMDRPEKFIPMAPPEPKPPLDARPQKLSVTEIGTWLRNPYGLYAKHVLGLKKLEDIDADISVADKGSAIHKALEDFMRGAAKKWPPHPLEQLLEKGREAFAPFKDKPQIEAFWWPRFENLAKRFVEQEELRRQEGYKPLFIEERAEMKIANSLTLSGRVDRIDEMPEGGVEIMDYKTGAVPSGAFVFSGFEPQLPLLAMLAEEGGFGGNGECFDAEKLSYWGLKGGKGEDKKTSFEADKIPSLIEKARGGLKDLVFAFANKDMPYRAVPRPIYAPKYDDYDHLARFAEWNRSFGGDR
ncbi:MAG TPA: double-strand break repair protein AddB, partial [Rhodospirillaceae bacterium]|nr:double-strand break repair protein AddB [Rhodospirillaceae bacterium]